MENIKDVIEKMNMAEVKAKAEELATLWTESAEFAEYKRMKRISDDIAECVARYAVLSEAQCIAHLLKADNPLKEAAMRLTYPTIKAKPVQVDDESEKEEMQITDAERKIDPVKLNRKADDGVGVNKMWPQMIERLTYACTIRRGVKLGIPADELAQIRDCFAMSKLAAEYDEFQTSKNPNAKNPTSEKVLLADLQKVVDAMIGEGEVALELKDVSFLDDVFAKKDNKKKLTETCSNPKQMRIYILEFINRVMTDDSYHLNCRLKKASAQ